MTEITKVGFTSGILNDQTPAIRNTRDYAMVIKNSSTLDSQGVEIAKPRRLGIRIHTFENELIDPYNDVVAAATPAEYDKVFEVQPITYDPVLGLQEQTVVNMLVDNHFHSAGHIASINFTLLANAFTGDQQWSAQNQQTASILYPYQEALRAKRQAPNMSPRYSPTAAEYDPGYVHYHYRDPSLGSPFNILSMNWLVGQNQFLEPEVQGDAKYAFKLLYLEFFDENNDPVPNMDFGIDYFGHWLAIDMTKSWLHIEADLKMQAKRIHPKLEIELSPHEGKELRVVASVPPNCQLKVPKITPPPGSHYDLPPETPMEGWKRDLEDCDILNYTMQGRVIVSDAGGVNTVNFNSDTLTVQYVAEYLGLPQIDVPTALATVPDAAEGAVSTVDVTIDNNMFLRKGTAPTEIGALVDVITPQGDWSLLSANWVYSVPETEGSSTMLAREFPAYLFRDWLGAASNYWDNDKTIWQNLAAVDTYKHNDFLDRAYVTSINENAVVGTVKVAPLADFTNPVNERICPFNSKPKGGTLRLRFGRYVGAGNIEFMEFDVVDAYNLLLKANYAEGLLMPLENFNGLTTPVVYSPLTTITPDTNPGELPPLVSKGQKRRVDTNFMHQHDRILPASVLHIPAEIVVKINQYADDIGLGNLPPEAMITTIESTNGDSFQIPPEQFRGFVNTGLMPDGSVQIDGEVIRMDFLPPAPILYTSIAISFDNGTVQENFRAVHLLDLKIGPYNHTVEEPIPNQTATFPITVSGIFGAVATQGPKFKLDVELWAPPESMVVNGDGNPSSKTILTRVTNATELVSIVADYSNLNVDIAYDEVTDTLTINDIKGAPLYLSINYHDATIGTAPVFTGLTWTQTGNFKGRLYEYDPGIFDDVNSIHFGATLPFTPGTLPLMPLDLNGTLITIDPAKQTELSAYGFVLSAADSANFVANITHNGSVPYAPNVQARMTLLHPYEIPLSRFVDTDIHGQPNPTNLYTGFIGYGMAVEFTNPELIAAIQAAINSGPEVEIATIELELEGFYRKLSAKHAVISGDGSKVTVSLPVIGAYRIGTNYIRNCAIDFSRIGFFNRWNIQVVGTSDVTDIPTVTSSNYNLELDISTIWPSVDRISIQMMHDENFYRRNSDSIPSIPPTNSFVETHYYLVDFLPQATDDMDLVFVKTTDVDSVLTTKVRMETGYKRSVGMAYALWLEGATVPPEFDVGAAPYKVVQYANGVGIYAYVPPMSLNVVPTALETISVFRTALDQIDWSFKVDLTGYPAGISTTRNNSGFFYPNITSEANINSLNGEYIQWIWKADGYTYSGVHMLSQNSLDSTHWNGTVGQQMPGLVVSEVQVPYDGIYKISQVINN